VKALFANIALAALWAAATGSLVPGNVLVGYALGFGILWWFKPLIGPTPYFGKLFAAVGFALFFIYELALSNVRVAWDVITPEARRRPGIVAVPLEAASDHEITLLSILVTLTPGTLVVDISDDRKVLYVHSMFVDDVEEERRKIKEGFERRVLDLLR
jgi:multicomponent Na+:H+ antiporter subunit E